MLQHRWMYALTVSASMGIVLRATHSGVRSFSFLSIGRSNLFVKSALLQKDRWQYSDSHQIFPFRSSTASELKHWRFFMTPFTPGSSLVDCSNTSSVGVSGGFYDAPSTTFRSSSNFINKNETADTGSPNRSEGVTERVEEVVQRTLFHEILPKIISSASTNGTSAIQESTASSYGNFINDVTIILGVSGGCDSIALLRLLQKILFRSPSAASDLSCVWNMVVVHFDHQQRREESDQDRLFVQSLCQQLNLPCFVYKWSERTSPSNTEMTSQACDTSFSQDTARQWRRSTMQQLLSEQIQTRCNFYPTGGSVRVANVCGMIVTAHHKDDSDETVLLKLLRGVHITNIAGLPSVLPCNNRHDYDSLSNENFDSNNFASTQSQSSSGKFSSSMFWVRPLIHLRKSDIIQFLRSNDYSWREDYTNKSNKYLRNRVRNELIPLLHDLMGSSHEALERRIDNLQQQSLEVRQFLNKRVQDHINEHVSDGDVYLLPEHMVPEDVDLIMKEALYTWTLKHTQGYHVSYEQMHRVYQQLISYPNRKKWQMNIGHHWNVIRYGDALRVARTDDALWNDSMYGYDSNSIVYRGKFCPTQTNPPPASNEVLGTWLRIQVPQTGHELSSHFIQSVVGDWSEDKLQFIPPWKTKNHPMNVKEFLRGQRIPMHMREATPIVVMIQHPDCRTDLKLVSSKSPIPPKLVAVYVSNRSQWLIDRELIFNGDEATNDSTVHPLYVSTFPITR